MASYAAVWIIVLRQRAKLVGVLKMNTTNLYLKYAEIIKMCEGTALEDKPWKCVKTLVETFALAHNTHPSFSKPSSQYEFAVAVLEDKPVFIGDVIYHKNLFDKQFIVSYSGDALNGENYGIDLCNIPTYASWQPVVPKRTFKLNGVELPCPLRVVTDYNVSIGSTRNGVETIRRFCFTETDQAKVFNEIERILEVARDK